MNFVNSRIKNIANLLGVEITKLKNVPSHTFLGISDLPINTIIDVGANKGQFAKIVDSAFPKAKIYSFEPLPTAFAELNTWAKTLGSTRIETFNVALGNEEGKVDMYHHTEHSPSSSILASTDEIGELYPLTKKQKPVSITLTTMNSFFQTNNIPLSPGILIKLDVQGYEDRVVKGGNDIFSQAVACIIEISIVELYENQADFKGLIDLLHSLDYHYAGNFHQSYSNNGECLFFDAVFIHSKNKKQLEY